METAERLLERDEALSLLGEGLSRAVAGRGGTTLVQGEAGIGKTSLVRGFAASVEDRATVLLGACDALFTPRPFGPLLDITRDWGAPIRQALAAGVDRGQLFATVIDELARAGPLVAVVEDLHWGDEATLDLLRFLGRRIGDLSVSLVLTFRDDEVGPEHPLRAVLGEWPRAGLTRIALQPLSLEAVGVLAAGSERSADELFRVTGGNAFFVTELLASGSTGVPESVTDAVLARLGRLTSAARAVAELASIVPGRIENTLIERLLAPDASALDECATRGILRAERGGLAFRHELARLAVLHSMSPGRTRDLHASVTAALLSSGGEPDLDRVVHHAAAAEDSATVLAHGPEAARRAAAVGSHREACSYWRTTLEHGPEEVTEERARLLEAHAYEAYLTGASEEAFASRLEAAEIFRALDEPLGLGRNLRWMSRLAWFLGRREDADRFAAEALRTLESAGDDRPERAEVAMAFSNRSQLAMLAHEIHAAIGWGTRAVELAEDLSDPAILAHALNNLGTSRLQAGDEAGRRELERSLDLSLGASLEEHAARAYTNLGSVAVATADPRASEYLERGIAYCTERDLDSWTDYMRGWRARLHFDRGAWNEAADDAEAVLVRTAAPAAIRLPSLIALTRLRIRRGDPGGEELLEEAAGLAAESDELQRIGPVAAARAELLWLRGEAPDRIAAAVRPAFERARKLGDGWTSAELALWMRRGEELEEVPAGLPEPWGAWVHGAWRDAAEGWERLGRPYERAEALTAGDEADLKEALDAFHALGAGPAAERVRGLLRERGVKGIARGPRPSTRANPAGLTRRQMEVLALLAEQLTYAEIARRLFVSKKTVEHHVGAILVRLSAASSKEAVELARTRGLLPQSGGAPGRD